MKKVDFRLAVDVGGTFTDLVLEAKGARTTLKVLTTPRAPEQAIVKGVKEILAAAGVAAESVGLFLHGTTLATNALIERKGARTALLTTAGFRDSVEMAYENRFEQYDLNVERPAPLVPRELRFELNERVAASGKVLLALKEDGVAELAADLRKRSVESIAVGFLHSYVNPEHEIRTRELLAKFLPDVTVTLSSEVSPEIREFDRFSTACANAYVQPLMSGYLQRLESELQNLGVSAPVFLMLSNGAITTVDIGIRFPVRLVEGGPAGGAILCSHIAAECDLDSVLAFDMGGTTAKICLIDECKPQTSRSFEVARAYRFLKGSGLPLKIPVVEMVEIGAGGGSIAKIDILGRLAVGPESAGSEPGPVCYGRGGVGPTVTDADLAMNWIDPGYFAGGTIQLNKEEAVGSIASAVGNPLSLDNARAAFAITEMVVENMASASRLHAIELGKDLRGRTLIATGGAAPLHAARLATKLGIDQIVVPTSAGVGSAAGFLKAPVGYEVVRSRYQRVDRLEFSLINQQFLDMHAEAAAVVNSATQDEVEETRVAYMRYVGQGHEIAIQLPNLSLSPGDERLLTKAFEDAYRRLYRRTIPDQAIEVLSWTLKLSVAQEAPQKINALRSNDVPRPHARRFALETTTGEFAEFSIYRRDALKPGERLSGPAIIAERETTIVVPADFDALVNSAGYIVLLRR